MKMIDLSEYLKLLLTIEEKNESLNRANLNITKLDEIERRYGKKDRQDIELAAEKLVNMLGYEQGTFFAVGGESFLLQGKSSSLPGRILSLKIAKISYNVRSKAVWDFFKLKVTPNRSKLRFVEGLQIQSVVSEKIRQATSLAAGVPNVIKLSKEPPIFAVLEWIEGKRFDHFCRETTIENKLVVYWRFLKLLEKIHSMKLDRFGSIVHRDIKPHNIIVDHSYKPWLTDFSITKPMKRENLTIAGERFGNVLYSAPEQLEGDQDETDWRSDQYAAAMLIPCVIANSYPPSAYHTRDIWINQQKNYINQGLWNVFKKAASWDQDKRFDTTAEFVRAFEKACLEYNIDFSKKKLVKNIENAKTQRLTCKETGVCPHANKIKQDILAEIEKKLVKFESILELIKELGK